MVVCNYNKVLWFVMIVNLLWIKYGLYVFILFMIVRYFFLVVVNLCWFGERDLFLYVIIYFLFFLFNWFNIYLIEVLDVLYVSMNGLFGLG